MTALLVCCSLCITILIWSALSWSASRADQTVTAEGPGAAQSPSVHDEGEPGDDLAAGEPYGPEALPKLGLGDGSPVPSVGAQPQVLPPMPPAIPIPEPQRTWAPVLPDAPQLAIVIDDWGYGWSAAERFLAFPAPLTVAVIPGLPFTQRHAQQAREAGHDVILHLPMEPASAEWELLPGTITTDMSDEAIRTSVARSLSEIPWIIGVNNHMGSKATQDARVMSAVLQTVYDAGYFFLDSRTTTHSVIPELAEGRAWEYLVNDRFLDNELQVDAIRERLVQAGRLAVSQGRAIAIGHVHVPTVEAAYAALPALQQMGVQLVPLSAFLTETPAALAYGMGASTYVAESPSVRPIEAAPPVQGDSAQEAISTPPPPAPLAGELPGDAPWIPF